jgi:cysteine desulfurase
MNLRYFDHNATTPLADAARDAWLDAAQTQWLNPSSPYRSAAAVRVRLEAARESLAARFGVESGRVVFTSGATEANNAVLRSWAERLPAGTRVGINPTEHPSVVEPGKAIFGGRVAWLSVGSDGLVDLEHLGRRLRSGELAAVSVMAANSETGVLQPWAAIAGLCAEARVPYHCDASQWVGKLPLEGLAACAYVTACAHKFGGPKGVGFMLLPDEARDFHILAGGAQEKSHRAGTEDVAGALALLAALDASAPGEPAGRDFFIERVQASIPGTWVVGAGAPRLWNTVSLIMPAHPSVRWIRALEKAGFLVSAGSACSTGKAAVSSVLLEMGLDPVAAGRVLRISSGADTTKEDWRALAGALAAACHTLDQESSASNSSVISID